MPIGTVVDDFARLVVGDRQHAAAASAEQPLVRGVERHRHGLLARRGRQRRVTVGAFASISTTSLVSVRFA